MMDLAKEVTNYLNLPRPQTRVYLAALELGEATVKDLAQKSGVKRTSIYNFLDELKKKGFISEKRKGQKRLISGTSPKNILGAEKYRLLSLQRLMPNLMALQNKGGNMPEVRFFEGVDGIKNVYEDTLSEEKNIYAWSNFENIINTMGDWIWKYADRRAKKGIPFRSIAEWNRRAEEVRDKNKEQLRDTKFVKTQKISTEINIYGNKVAMMSFEGAKPFAVIIEDEGISKTLIGIWKEMWKMLPENK